MQRAAEGLEHIRYAMRLSPREPNRAYWLMFECNAQLELGRYQEAIESCRRSTSLNPGYTHGWAGLVAATALSGKIDEAHTHLAKLKALVPHLPHEALVARFGGHKAYPARVREGLQLALKAQ